MEVLKKIIFLAVLPLLAQGICTTSLAGIDLIKKFEGFNNKAYQDSVGVWTIGWGTIQYPNGVKVKKGDTITTAQAETYLKNEVDKKAASVCSLLGSTKVNQNQFDALTSFTYNLGVGALSGSTLLKKVKANPNDPAIRAEFMKWVYAGGKVIQGLVNRRNLEANLYFK